jgi:hypothetical protein
MNNGKIHSIPIGSLVRDVDQGDIGIVVGPVEVLPLGGMGDWRTQLVFWPNHLGETAEMDLSAIEQGWVEVTSEAR